VVAAIRHGLLAAPGGIFGASTNRRRDVDAANTLIAMEIVRIFFEREVSY
jgi:hypothetical protein